MPLELIHDSDDPRLADYRGLTDTALRRMKEPEEGLYIAESVKVIARAVNAGHIPRSVLTQRRWIEQVEEALAGQDAPVYVVADDVAERVTGYAVHRGALASMQRPALPGVADVLRAAKPDLARDDLVGHANVCEPEGHTSHPPKGTRSRIAILEGLTDHANLGSGFRNAAALGVDAVLVTPTCADPLYRRSVRVSMGTVFQVPWTRIPAWPAGIDELRAAGYVVAGMTLGEGAITLDELVAEDHEKLALVFGTEGDGIMPATDRLLDRRVTIPMMGGVDSLNVAAATAVTFYATR
ncbi:TrmH family RNA methyltransferase [Microbacterium sp. AGC85]